MTVSDKIAAALALHSAEQPGAQMSVTALAHAAGINRSNLYSTYPALIAELKQKRLESAKPKRPKPSAERIKALEAEIVKLRHRNKALIFLNIELRQEVARLTRRLPKK
jgi:transposase-like protein